MTEEKGLLIAFEGAARSGKSTLIHGLKERLLETGQGVTFTEWNSYPGIQEIINHKKTHFTFTPLTYSLMHLADFALRYEEIVQPALERNHVVIADRWIYTALTRDVARGMSREIVRTNYSFARKPDLVFYVEVPVEVAYQRHCATKPYFGYNSGKDIWENLSPEESFRLYHQRITELYSELTQEEGFVKLNGLETPDTLIGEVIKCFDSMLSERRLHHGQRN